MGASKQLNGQYEILYIIVSSMKTPRHVNYHPKQDSNGTFLDGVETPCSVGLALQVQKETHNRKIIDCLSELNLTLDNKKSLKSKQTLSMRYMGNMNKIMAYMFHQILFTKCQSYLLLIILTFIAIPLMERTNFMA